MFQFKIWMPEEHAKLVCEDSEKALNVLHQLIVENRTISIEEYSMLCRLIITSKIACEHAIKNKGAA